MNRKELGEHLNNIAESSLKEAADNPSGWATGCGFFILFSIVALMFLAFIARMMFIGF